jgi:hypothetical protein
MEFKHMIISELIGDILFIIQYRQKHVKQQKNLDRYAPKAGEIAPDFKLYDSSGIESVTLSEFRDKKPVALVFGSYT